jgi:hypothetical protein
MELKDWNNFLAFVIETHLQGSYVTIHIRIASNDFSSLCSSTVAFAGVIFLSSTVLTILKNASVNGLYKISSLIPKIPSVFLTNFCSF